MNSKAKLVHEGPGCPLHTSGDPAPDTAEDYSIGAWLRAPVGTQGNRPVCDRCVKKIKDGIWDHYVYTPNTGEVTSKVGKGQTVKFEVIELQKQFIREKGCEATAIKLPLLKAMDLIAEEPSLFGNVTASDLDGKSLFGMDITITNENAIVLG